MSMKDWSPAYRRYQQRLIGASMLYLLSLLPVVWLFNHKAPQGVLAYGLAVLPALPVIGMFAAMGLFLREETDEFQRFLVVRQILISTGLTLSVCSVWGFLETFVSVHHFEAYWVAVVWFLMFGAARFMRWGL